MVFILLIIGLSLLLVGGTALVRGASGIAGQYGISPLIVGLTVVAFGTSAPELVVNVIGALRNQTDIAFGNVVGSNLANMGLVLCVAALIKPMVMHGQIVRRELPLLLLGTLCPSGHDAGSFLDRIAVSYFPFGCLDSASSVRCFYLYLTR